MIVDITQFEEIRQLRARIKNLEARCQDAEERCGNYLQSLNTIHDLRLEVMSLKLELIRTKEALRLGNKTEEILERHIPTPDLNIISIHTK